METSHLIYLIGFCIFATIRSAYGRKAQREEKVVRRVDWQERILLAILGIGHLLLPVVYLFAPLLDFADYSLPDGAIWIGTVMLAASLWLFWRSHADLGLNWSITLEMRENHAVVTHGVYRWMRHPMYGSIWLWGIAQMLLLQNWIAGPGTLVPFAILYFLRTPREEQMLVDTLGDAYREYMESTGRLGPRFRKK